MSVTFKLRAPHGLCRRATFSSTPELRTLSEMADGMITADAHQLLYRDSEGDWVTVADSSDVAEAVRDAKQARAATVMLHVRPRRKQQSSSAAKATTSDTATSDGRPPRCGGAAHRARGCGWVHHPLHPCAGLLGGPWAGPHPLLFPRRRTVVVGLDDFARDVEELADAIWGRRRRSPSAGRDSSHKAEAAASSGADAAKADAAGREGEDERRGAARAPDAESAAEERAPVPESASTTTDATADTDQPEVTATTTVATVAPTHDNDDNDDGDRRDDASAAGEADIPPTSDGEAAVAVGFVQVEAPPAEEAQDAPAAAAAAAPESSDGVDAKVALLSDMGFDLPADVSRNMIREMGGRMDLIVRALVANKL